MKKGFLLQLKYRKSRRRRRKLLESSMLPPPGPKLFLAIALLANVALSACTHSSIPSVSDQILPLGTFNQQVTVAAMTNSGCPALQYEVKTSPSGLSGGASVTFTGSEPSVFVTQDSNIDSFAVSITHESASGEVYAQTAFMVHPADPDPTSADYAAFCTTNPYACLCAAGTCPTITDFCGTDFHMDPAVQPSGFEYEILNPAVPATFQLNQFTFPGAQLDYGCPQDTYTLQVEDPTSPGTFLSHSDVTLDTSSLQMTIGLGDEAYAGDTIFRLVFNSQNYADFTVSICHLPIPVSIFADPTQSLIIIKQVTPEDIFFADYSYVGGSTCGTYTSTVSAVLPEVWFTFDDTVTAPVLTVDSDSSGVTTSEDFDIDFQVEDDSGTIVVTETVTVTVINCDDLVGSGLAFDALGPAEVTVGIQDDTFDWNLTDQTSYTMTIMPVEYTAECGTPNAQLINASDTSFHTFTNYAVESVGPLPLTITFTLDSGTRAMTQNDETISFDIFVENTYGLDITTTVTIRLHLCAQAPLVNPGSVCRFYMNRSTGECVYPENTEMHVSCGNPLDFMIEDAVSSANLVSVSNGNISWANQQASSGANHKLLFDFSGFSQADMIALIGVYSAERLQSVITETFQVALCYFYEPGSIYVSSGDDKFQYNRSKNGGVTQVFDIELSLYDMSTSTSLCQGYFYALDNDQTWTELVLASAGVEPTNVLRVTITGTTPVGEVTLTYRIESTDGTYKKEHNIMLNVIDCNELGQVHGSNLVSSQSSSSDRFYMDIWNVRTFTHEEFFYGQNTICAALNHVVTNNRGLATTAGSTSPYISYKNNVWNNREIEVDLTAWDSGQHQKWVTVTITVDNSANDPNFTGNFSADFYIRVRNCVYDDLTVPVSSAIFAIANNEVTHTLDSDSLSGADTKCHPVTMSIAVEDPAGSGTWNVVESGVYQPAWITSINQHDTGTSTPYSYTFTFEMALTTLMPSYKVKNYVTNTHGGPITKESDEWWIHFYAVDINGATGNPVWFYPSRSANDGVEFTFTKLQTNPTQLETYYLYDTRNSNVVLNDGSDDVDYVDYDTCCGMYSVTVTTPTKNLVIDMNSMPVYDTSGTSVAANSYTYANPTPIPDFFSDPMLRRVAVTDTFGNSGGYVPELDNSLTVNLYDCSFDFPTPADNLDLIYDEENNASFDGTNFRYQIDLGANSIDVKILAPSWPLVCGAQVITFTVDATGASYISFTPDVSHDYDAVTGDLIASWGRIDIIEDVTLDISEFSSESYFTIKNDEYEVKLDLVPLLINKFNCHLPKTFTNLPWTDTDTVYVIDKATTPNWNWNWDPMVFDDAFCVVQEYKVTCQDPAGVDHTVLAGVAGGSLCDIFTADTSLNQRLITIPDHSLILNHHEGVYTFTVEGMNTLSPTNTGVYTLQLTIEPDCGITTITAPAEFSFANDFGAGPFIGIDTFVSGSYSLTSQFGLSVTTICQMSFHLMHSTDGGTTYTDSVPSYISMSPVSGGTTQPWTISIDGTLTTNEQFTGEGDQVKYAIEARVVGESIAEMTKFDVIFFPNCLKTHVKIQDTIDLLTQTVHLGLISDTLLISSADTDLTKAVLSNINDDPLLEVWDKATCTFKDDQHAIDIYSQTSDILSLTVQQELSTEDEFEILTRADLVNADIESTLSDACKLYTLGEIECTISYEIQVWTYNSTWILAHGDVVFVNECLSLKTLYAAAGNAAPMWQWPAANQAVFDQGYALRQTQVSFLLPQVYPVLNSGLSVQSQCGDITYTVDNPDYEIFSIDSLTITVDNSQPLRVMAYTLETAKIAPFDAIDQDYQFKLSVQIELFKAHADAVTYEYYSSSPLESTRQAHLRFYLRDFCREPTFTETSLVILDPTTLYDYQEDPALGQLMMEKKILSTATIFYLTYLDYTTEEEQWTGVQYPCGLPEEIIYETQPVTADNEIFADVISQSVSPTLWLTNDGLKYTVEPMYNDQANGAYYFTVKATVSQPAEAVGAETIGSTIMQVFMKIKPCEVLEVNQGNQIFSNYNLLIEIDTALLQFEEFKQVPACNYTMTYDVTIAEIVSSGTPVDFDDQESGSRIDDPPIATFDPELLTMDFFSSNYNYSKRTFTVFVIGHAWIDLDLQGPIFGVSDGFNVKFSEVPSDPPDSKPVILDFTSKFELVAGSVEEINVGVPQDFQLRPVTVTWDFVTFDQDYIVEVDENGTDEILFKVSPPIETAPNKIQIELLLEVDEVDPPLYSTFYIEIQVLEYVPPEEFVVDTGIEVKESNDERDPIETLVSITEISELGLLQVRFSEAINWPDDTKEWTSENWGAEFIELIFVASDHTYYTLDEGDLEMLMSWKVAKVSANVLTLQMDFSLSEIVSKLFIKGELDFVELNLLEKWDTDLQVSVKNKSQKLEARILPQVDEDQKRLALQTVQLTEGGVAVAMGANIVTTLLSAQVIQYLWGIINSLQLIVLTVLYALHIPPICFDVLISIMKLTNLDLIDVEFLFDAMFKFRQTEPINATFEQAGYDSTNFFVELGPLFFIILVYLVWTVIRKMIQWIGRTVTSGGNCLTRWMRKKSNFVMVVVRFFFEGCVEVGLSTLICITTISRDNFGAPWESLSTCLALLMSLIFLLFPLYLTRAKRILLSQTKAGIKNSWYADLFPDLQKKDASLGFTIVYFARRYLLVLSICLPPQHEIIQLFVHILVSLGSLAYLLAVHPFELKSKNGQEIVNELAVLLASYHLPIFSEWSLKDPTQEYTGWSMLGIIILMVTLNIILILVIFFKQGIRKCRIRRVKKAIKKREVALHEAKELKLAVEKERKARQLEFERQREIALESIQEMIPVQTLPSSTHPPVTNPQSVQKTIVQAKLKTLKPDTNTFTNQVSATIKEMPKTPVRQKQRYHMSDAELISVLDMNTKPASYRSANRAEGQEAQQAMQVTMEKPQVEKPVVQQADPLLNPYLLSQIKPDLFVDYDDSAQSVAMSHQQMKEQLKEFRHFIDDSFAPLQPPSKRGSGGTEKATDTNQHPKKSSQPLNRTQDNFHKTLGQGMMAPKKHKLDLSQIGKSFLHPRTSSQQQFEPVLQMSKKVSESYQPRENSVTIPNLNLNFNQLQHQKRDSGGFSVNIGEPWSQREAAQETPKVEDRPPNLNRFMLSPVKYSLLGLPEPTKTTASQQFPSAAAYSSPAKASNNFQITVADMDGSVLQPQSANSRQSMAHQPQLLSSGRRSMAQAPSPLRLQPARQHVQQISPVQSFNLSTVPERMSYLNHQDNVYDDGSNRNRGAAHSFSYTSPFERRENNLSNGDVRRQHGHIE